MGTSASGGSAVDRRAPSVPGLCTLCGAAMPGRRSAQMTAVAALGACLLLASGVTGAGLAHDVAPSAPLGAGLGRGRAESPLQRIVVAKAEAASSGGSVEKSVFIRATPEECFRVATAYEDYPKWAKATAGVSVLSRTGELGKQVEMRMGMFGIEVKSTFEYSYNRPTQMEWKSVAGNIKVRPPLRADVRRGCARCARTLSSVSRLARCRSCTGSTRSCRRARGPR